MRAIARQVSSIDRPLPRRPQPAGIDPAHHVCPYQDLLGIIACDTLERAYVEAPRPHYHAGEQHLPVTLGARRQLYGGKTVIKREVSACHRKVVPELVVRESTRRVA